MRCRSACNRSVPSRPFNGVHKLPRKRPTTETRGAGNNRESLPAHHAPKPDSVKLSAAAQAQLDADQDGDRGR
jgi:hypothetical protein